MVKKICSWHYINCIDLWVAFISANIQDYDLQPLLYMIVQIINGVALLFPGPRYLPLRLRCIQWLNLLSGSSGVFIPVTSLVLDVLDYKITKDDGKPGKLLEPLSTIKVRHNLTMQAFSFFFFISNMSWPLNPQKSFGSNSFTLLLQLTFNNYYSFQSIG